MSSTDLTDWQKLRALRELHAPQSTPVGKIACWHCTQLKGSLVGYPCPTRSIVEAPHERT